MIKKFCLHRHDADGIVSGAIVKKAVPSASLYKIDYSDPVPWKRIKEADKIYMVDFSLKSADLKNILKMGKKFVLIEHYVSKIKDLNLAGLISSLTGRIEDGRAGCHLAWEYFYPGQDVPDVVRYIADRDIREVK